MTALRTLVFSLFFLSGTCGLIYQVVWSRMMTQIFGSTVLAVGTVLAAFMSGLALGSYFLGRRGDRSPNPLRLYAAYELGIGLTALVSLWLIDRSGGLYLALNRAFGDSTALIAVARFVVAFALMLVPTVLMGATLPVLARFVINRLTAVGSSLSTLYAVNTAGAVAGVLLAGFYLIAALGIHGSIYLAVAGNVGIGLIAWMVSSRLAGSRVAAPPDARASPAAVAAPRVGYRVLLFAFALSGFASFAYEIYWTRSLVHLLGNSTYAFSMMLTAFLCGIALGGYLIRFVVDRVADRTKWFAWLQILTGLASAVALPVLFAIVDSAALKGFLHRMSGELGMLMVSRFAVALLVMLVPATMIGATFPLVASIFVKDLRLTGTGVGKVYAVNTVGNVLGALAPGFLLLPALGVQKGIVLMAALNISIGAFLLLAGSTRLAPGRLAVPVGFVIIAAVLPGFASRFQFPSQEQAPEDWVLYYREGPAGTTKVFQDRNTGHKRMSIDGIVIGGTEFTDYKQQVLAHLPKLLLPAYDSELSIGLGSGILIGESLRHPDLGRIVCVEIEPSVAEGAAHFAAENHNVLNDARARIVVDDVANFLRTTDERYDIISADEKTADKYASNGYSYSADYYALLREHLTPGGLVIQWVPSQLPSSQFRMVLNTFSKAFPSVAAWYFAPVLKGGPSNTFLVGSEQPLEIDLDRMNRTLAKEGAAFDGWRQYGIATGEAVLAHYTADQDAVREAVGDAQENSLEHPYYEFYSPREYAEPSNGRVLRNHDLLVSLRRAQGPGSLAQRSPSAESSRLESAAQAESAFLTGLGLQLRARPRAKITAAYQTALELAPWNDNLRAQIVSYYWNMAGAHYLQGDYRTALFLMEEAVRTYPGHGEVRYYHGLMLLQTGATDDAVEELREAVTLDGRLLPPRRILASVLLESGALEEAAEHVEAILAVDPEDDSALRQRQIILQQAP